MVLVMDKGKEYLIVPELETSRQVFDGPIDAEELAKISGIETVITEKDGWKRLGSRLKKVQHVATLGAPAPYIGKLGMYTNPARARLIETIKSHNEAVELLDLRQHVAVMRMVKQDIELAAIRSAVKLTETVLGRIAPKLHRYGYEYEIEADISAAFRKAGSHHAYDPIIAVGKNACILHYVENKDAVKEGNLIVIDVGANVGGYAADITRTYAVGKPSRRHQKVHAAALAVQQYAKGLLKPGVMMKEYEQSVEQFMGEKLRELGLIKTISREAVRKYYPHSTSHFLGLDVHDVADYERPLEAGNVLTVEPGIYIPEEGFGVRLEDNVLITEKGIEVLSDKLPLGLA